MFITHCAGNKGNENVSVHAKVPFHPEAEPWPSAGSLCLPWAAASLLAVSLQRGFLDTHPPQGPSQSASDVQKKAT